MAHPNSALIGGLRTAAAGLVKDNYYAWGHHGACNCGHLLQATTQLTKEEIVTYAHTGIGEWTELAQENCTVTGASINLLLTKLQQLGLTPTDIHNIEYLEDREVLNRLPGGFRWLKRNVRADVILYFETMANMLEEKLISNIEINYSELLSKELINTVV